MISVERARGLHAVAAHGSVAAAAAALHVTASALSQQLSKLEREVGQPLLERHGRGVHLTDAGRLLVAHTDHILLRLAHAEADLEALQDSVVGRMVIAAFATAARGLLPSVLRQLRDDHPRLHVELREMEPRDALDLVTGGEADLAVVDDWFNAPLAVPATLTRRVLYDDVADLALPADHPLAADVTEVDLRRCTEQSWITWPRGQFCHDWLVHTLRSMGTEPHIAHTAAEHQTQLALVAAGLGAAVVPRLGRGHIPEGVVMVPVRPRLTRRVYTVWRDGADARPAIHASVNALRGRAIELTS